MMPGEPHREDSRYCPFWPAERPHRRTSAAAENRVHQASMPAHQDAHVLQLSDGHLVTVLRSTETAGSRARERAVHLSLVP